VHTLIRTRLPVGRARGRKGMAAPHSPHRRGIATSAFYRQPQAEPRRGRQVPGKV